MRSIVLLLSAVAAACAGNNSTSAAPAPASQTVRVQGPTGTSNLTISGSDNGSSVHAVPFSVDQVWRALPDVFTTMGLPVQALESGSKTIGASSFAVRRKLKDVALSRLIDCGSSGLGPNADDYDVRLSFVVTVSPAQGGGTNVSTTFEAAARPMNFAQDFSQCTSRGALESRFIDALKERLSR